MSEWISVKDRLPDIGERVLCYGVSMDSDQRNIYTADYKKIGKYDGYYPEWMGDNTMAYGQDNVSIEYVTYWMPLDDFPNIKTYNV